MNYPRNPRNTITLLVFLAVILGAALIVAVAAILTLLPSRRAQPEPEPGPAIVVDGMLVMERAAEYGVSMEFLQMILPGYLVYSDGGDYVYQPINESLPLHGYDWDKLYYAYGRTMYEDEAFPDISYGIDVSLYQNDIDWQAVAEDNISFAIIRAGYRGYSQGALFIDEQAAANLAGASAAGLDIGVYFFSQAVTEEEAVEEAELVLSMVEGYELAFPIVCDMEEISNDIARIDALSVAERSQVIKAFCQTVEQAGRQAMIYGNIRWLAGRMDMKELSAYPLWLAQYYDYPLFPYDFDIWQYTSTGQVAGIEGPVDINICFKRSWAD